MGILFDGDEWRAASQIVSRAEQALREARLHSRSRLVEAHVNREGAGGRSVADCEGELDLRCDQARHAEEVEDALRDEAADIENGLQPLCDRVAKAAGAFASRTPQVLGLVTRIHEAFATLRDVRLAFLEVRKLV